MIIGLGQNLRRCPGARLGLPGRTNICGVIPHGEDRAELWALAEGPHARLSLSSCKAGPAFCLEFVSHTSRLEGVGCSPLPSQGWTDSCTGSEKLPWW